jgi:hypothetical protein
VTRCAIRSLGNHLSAVKDAPVPKTDAKKLAAEYVRQLAARGQPLVHVDSRGLRVDFIDPQRMDPHTALGDAIAVMAWCDPNTFLAAIEREINALPEMRDAIRDARTAELAANLDVLERQEESLVVAAEVVGLGVRGAHDDALENSLRDIDCMLAVLHLAGAILFMAMRPIERLCRPSAVRAISDSASEAGRRERFGLLAGNISLMPNGAFDGFNRVLDFDESLTRVFRVTAIVFLRQMFCHVAAVRNLFISCCDQFLNVLVILSHSGLLLIHPFAQQFRQLGDVQSQCAGLIM